MQASPAPPPEIVQPHEYDPDALATTRYAYATALFATGIAVNPLVGAVRAFMFVQHAAISKHGWPAVGVMLGVVGAMVNVNDAPVPVAPVMVSPAHSARDGRNDVPADPFTAQLVDAPAPIRPIQVETSVVVLEKEILVHVGIPVCTIPVTGLATDVPPEHTMLVLPLVGVEPCVSVAVAPPPLVPVTTVWKGAEPIATLQHHGQQVSRRGALDRRMRRHDRRFGADVDPDSRQRRRRLEGGHGLRERRRDRKRRDRWRRSREGRGERRRIKRFRARKHL